MFGDYKNRDSLAELFRVYKKDCLQSIVSPPLIMVPASITSYYPKELFKGKIDNTENLAQACDWNIPNVIYGQDRKHQMSVLHHILQNDKDKFHDIFYFTDSKQAGEKLQVFSHPDFHFVDPKVGDIAYIMGELLQLCKEQVYVKFLIVNAVIDEKIVAEILRHTYYNPLNFAFISLANNFSSLPNSDLQNMNYKLIQLEFDKSCRALYPFDVNFIEPYIGAYGAYCIDSSNWFVSSIVANFTRLQDVILASKRFLKQEILESNLLPNDLCELVLQYYTS